MELVELLDRCLYEDELRDILIFFGESPEGMKNELISKLMESKQDTAEVLKLIDEDMLTIVCLESGVPIVMGKDPLIELVLEDVLGETHDYIEIEPQEEVQSAEPPSEDMDDEVAQPVDFDEIVDQIGDWEPVNTFLPKSVIINELGDFLRRLGYRVWVKNGFDILVGNNVAVELARGREPSDMDKLFEKLNHDIDEAGSAIGVIYGAVSESVVNRMEESIEGTFDDQDKVAIVLI